jgi:hypothetical protein
MWGVWVPGRQSGNEPNPQNSPAQVIPIGDLKTRIQDRLKYGDCTDYIKKLIAKVAEQNPGNPASPADIMGLYDQINGQTNGGGFVGTRHLVAVDTDGRRWPTSGLTEGSLKRGNALIQISLVESYGTPNTFNLRHAGITYGITGLHEIIHQSGSQGFYTDYQLAVAAKALNGNVWWSPKADNSMRSILDNSSYWDSELKNHCVPESNR